MALDRGIDVARKGGGLAQLYCLDCGVKGLDSYGNGDLLVDGRCLSREGCEWRVRNEYARGGKRFLKRLSGDRRFELS